MPIWEVIYLATTFAFISLLTPCVFPMIPLTVGFFIKRQNTPLKDALFYMLGIMSSFVILGFVITLIFGASGLYKLSTNPIVNLFLAILFILLALNLLGVYEVRIPSRWINSIPQIKNPKTSKNDGWLIIFMGVIFTLTTFTCTMPFIGSLLVSISKGDLFSPIIGMSVYGLVFSIPFFILTITPSLLKKWQNSKQNNWILMIKPFIGFLEIIFAFKFISNIDLVYQWGLFTRDIFLSLSIFIGILAIIYFFYFFYHKHRIRVSFCFMAFFMLLNIFLGFSYRYTLWEDLNAFLPPKDYGSIVNKASSIKWYSTLEEAKKVALLENKLLFINFTGYTCTNCRFMEENILILPKIKNKLKKYVNLKLYIDGDGEVYEKNQEYQENKFQNISIPFYAILSPNETIKDTWLGMTRNPQEFYEFLKKY